MCRGMRDKCEKKTGTASGNRHCFAGTACVVYNETMDVYTTQHYAVQFCQCLSFTKKETIPLVKEAYTDAVSLEVTIQRWYRDFEKGWESGELKPKNHFARISTLTPSPPTTITTSRFELSQTSCTHLECRCKEFWPKRSEWKECVVPGCHISSRDWTTFIYEISIPRLVFHVQRWSSTRWMRPEPRKMRASKEL